MNDYIMAYINLTKEQFEALSTGKIIPSFGMKAIIKDLWCLHCRRGALIFDGHEIDGGARYYCNNCFKYCIDYSAR